MATAPAPEIAMYGPDRVEPSGFNVPWQKFMMWIFLCSDGMGFIGLLSAYAMLRFGAEMWPMLEWFQQGTPIYESLAALLAKDPNYQLLPADVFGFWGIQLTALNTFVLICSSVTMVKAYSACLDGDQKKLSRFLLMTIAGGVFFLGMQAYEWTHLIMDQGLNVGGNPLGATFYALTGFHGAHVLSGVIYLTFIWNGARKGRYGPKNAVAIENVGLFWHFVDLVWIVVFTVVYLF